MYLNYLCCVGLWRVATLNNGMMTGVDTGVTEVRGQLRTNRDSALGSIHEVCKGLAEIGEGKQEKRIILILTRSCCKVAAFLFCHGELIQKIMNAIRRSRF